MTQRIYLLLFGLILYAGSIVNVNGQNRETHPALASIAISQAAPGWIHFRDELNLRPKTVFEEFKAAFSLRESESMVLRKTETDALGFTHFRYQLHYNGIPVEGADYMLHAKDGIAKKANGFLPMDLNVSPVPQIDADQAFNLAIAHMGADAYMWESSRSEEALQHAHHDPSASFMPEAELLIANSSFSPDNQVYRLVWKLDIYASQPHSRKWIYVDAMNGSIVKELETLHTANSVGTAQTKYSGTQTIVTDSITDVTGTYFRLRESKRGESPTYSGVDIETYDLNQSTLIADAVDFIDDDNMWDNINPELDEAATDAHWGAEVTHDYFFEKFDRSSYDDNGSRIISYVHFDTAVFNAFWNGSWMTYGDGNNAPLTSLDVVGHELAHGVTGTSAGLIYSNESGALNESFSDIFGNAVEQFGDPSVSNWLIGEAFGTPLRNMANPNQFGDPDTYKGTNWWTSAGDNGGVHVNSGVQNFWFYLLVEGGSGVNDLGQAYDVPALGWTVATQIAYRNLTAYLNPSSQFLDAKEGALESTADLFGICSFEYLAVAEAWHAVGVGDKILSNDFGVVNINPIEICGNTDEEYISIEIGYFGCDTFPGGQILATYTVADPFSSAAEQVILPSMVRGTPYTHQFSQALQMDQEGDYEIFSRTLSPIDTYAPNDSSAFINAYRKGYFTNERIDFENYVNSFSILDSVHFSTEGEASVSIQGQVGADSSFAIQMEGGSRDNFQVLFSPVADPAGFNTEYQTRACMCVDAKNMDSLSLSFDLRQTFSPYWSTAYSNFIDSTITTQRVNLLRFMLNDQELGRYNAISYELDPWNTHEFNLDAYVGQSINLCFLATLNQSKAIDNFGIGDQVFIDNINFSSVSSPISSVGDLYLARDLQAYPNPTSNQVTIDYEGDNPQSLTLRVFNALGQLVTQKSWKTAGGSNRMDLSLGHLPEGVYSLHMQDEKGWLSKKIILK